MINIIEVNKQIFENTPNYLKIISEPHSRSYGYFDYKDVRYALSWQSDIIKPEIFYLKNYELILIGIDMKVVALDSITGSIKFSLGLSQNFKFFISTFLGFIIVTESSLIFINGIDCSIQMIKGYSDIITNCLIKDNVVFVEFLDEPKQSINLI